MYHHQQHDQTRCTLVISSSHSLPPCLVYLFTHVIAVLLVLLTDLLVLHYQPFSFLLYDLELDDDYYPLRRIHGDLAVLLID